jgi:AcrR family transcriptional regulator
MRAVLRAADDLLVEQGFAAVTIEKIAARAGVAKQTICRWWPSKVEVLLETLREDAVHALEVPEGSSVRQELRARLQRLAKFLAGDPAGQVLLALVGHAQHDPATAQRLDDEFFGEQRRQDRERLRRGIQSGELPGDLRVDDALDALYGPVYYRARITRTRTPGKYLDELVTAVLGASD